MTGGRRGTGGMRFSEFLQGSALTSAMFVLEETFISMPSKKHPGHPGEGGQWGRDRPVEQPPHPTPGTGAATHRPSVERMVAASRI